MMVGSGPAQFLDLLSEFLDLSNIRAGHPRSFAPVDLVPFDPRPKRLDPATQLAGNPLDRPHILTRLLAELIHHPHRTLPEFNRISASRPITLIIHNSILASKLRSLQLSQGDSLFG